MSEPEGPTELEVIRNWLFLLPIAWRLVAIIYGLGGCLLLVAAMRGAAKPALPPGVTWAVGGLFLVTGVLSIVIAWLIRHRQRWRLMIWLTIACCLHPGASLVVGALTLLMLFRPTCRELFS